MSNLELFSPHWMDVWQGGGPGEMGSVYTRREVVDLMLDLAGYVDSDGPLSELRLLEPSCGEGAFLDAVVDRLVRSEALHFDRVDWRSSRWDRAVRGSDISLAAVDRSRSAVSARLVSAGCPGDRAAELAHNWILHTDFLLHEWDTDFDFVIGNPPYVRLEGLPRHVLSRYRERFRTATDRADLYIPFIERSLELLSASGCLAFICSNRFTRNRYGAALRNLISRQFHVRYYLNMEHTQPFEENVAAYPAVVVVDRSQGFPTLAATLESCDADLLQMLSPVRSGPDHARAQYQEFASWYVGSAPWVSTTKAEHAHFASMDSRYPTIENSAPGTKVGIGAATGADDVFVLPASRPDIEPCRQLPLLMARDVRVEGLAWSGRYLINPFEDEGNGSLVDPEEFPGLAAYLTSHEARLRKRHVARSRPSSWYRTIDRVWPALLATPKLVIPDIQRGGVIGLDKGEYYPHHNLYWITSTTWPLAALQAILRSTLVLRQVRALSVQMRGGSIRYQAQTLRKIRIPSLVSIPAALLAELASLGASSRQTELDEAVQRAYNA